MESDTTPVLPYLSTVSFDRLLPLGELTSEDFERFACDLLTTYYLDAKVSLKKKCDHKQDAAEIRAKFFNGSLCTYQCRQTKQFDAEDVGEAIKALRTGSGQKHILLSCEVNSEVRHEIRKFRDWELWDQVDITHRFRELPEFEQARIVDIYFPGQRFDLTLLPCALSFPWLTAKDFFAPMMAEDKAFHHRWDLVGRDSECNQLLHVLANSDVHVMSLVGHAGSGKTRVLRSVLESFSETHPHVRVVLASPTGEIWWDDLNGLGDGENLLVVDDAHDCCDYRRLLRYMNNERKRTRLLLVYRTYCEEIIQIDMAREGFCGKSSATVRLGELTKHDARVLALQVLAKHGGEAELADMIADVASGSPLAVVLGAQIIASVGANSEIFHSIKSFRSAVLAHYKNIIMDDVATGDDRACLDKMLRVYALIQPLDINDPGVTEILSSLEGIERAEAWRLSERLTDTGILYKRNALFRLLPDLLADAFIDSDCIAPDGKSSGYAERIFDFAVQRYKENILLNLSRFDWQRGGSANENHLVDAIWSRLGKDDTWRVQASVAVIPAFYQPRQALDFARRLVSQGHGTNESVCRIIRNAAYRFEYLRDACELLWEIAKTDTRPIERREHRSNQPISLLKLLAMVTPEEPIIINKTVVDFALSLLDREDSWTGAATPFDILKGGLDADSAVPRVYSTTFKSVWYGTSLEIHEAIAPMRRRIIDAIFKSLTSSRKRQALAAAALLENALCTPRWLDLPAGKEAWLNEFVDTLTRLNALLDANHLPAVVLTRLAQSVSWHADYAHGSTHLPARQIFDRLDYDIETHATCELMGNYMGYTRPDPVVPQYFSFSDAQLLPIHRIYALRAPGLMTQMLSALMDNFTASGDPNPIELVFIEYFKQWKPQLEKIAGDIENAFPREEDLIAFLGERLADIMSYYEDNAPRSAEFLIRCLFERQISLTRLVLNIIQQDTQSPLRNYASHAFSALFRHAPDEAREYIAARLAEGENHLPLIASFYANTIFRELPYRDDDFDVMARIFQSCSRTVLEYAPRIFETVSKKDPRIAIGLIAQANPALIKALDVDIFRWMDDDELNAFYNSLDDEALGHIMRWFSILDCLDDSYATNRILSIVASQRPRLLLDLIKMRLERALAEEKDNDNYFTIGDSKLDNSFSPYNLLEHPDGKTLLRETLDWALPRVSDALFSYHFAWLVAGLFRYRYIDSGRKDSGWGDWGEPTQEDSDQENSGWDAPAEGNSGWDAPAGEVSASEEAPFISVLETWIADGSADRFAVMAALLHKAPTHFVSNEEEFLKRILCAAQSAGASVCKALTEALYASAVTGQRIGYGGPPSHDDMWGNAEEKLASLNKVFVDV
ncbi:MAG: hypothetical protein FWC40_02830 [Proteobacteria bacterium]|nr:hypothetical protein [Pseudomonadota bacterium]